MSEITDLVRRLRGEYRIPITDGLGAAGGDEPDNAKEFVRNFGTSPIKTEAADTIETLTRRLAKATDEIEHWKQWSSINAATAHRLSDYAKALEARLDELAAERDAWEAAHETANEASLTAVRGYAEAEARADALRAACVAARDAFDELLVSWAETLVAAGADPHTVRHASDSLSTLDAVLGERDEG